MKNIKNMVVKLAGISALFTAAFTVPISAHATINCAGYLPNSYFERIENNKKPFAGKLITLKNGSQQLQDVKGNVLLSDLGDAYILMDKYLLASKVTIEGKKYGVVTATGAVIVPFAYDAIATEPDIYTSFIVSVNTADGLSNQGITDRNGYWIYPIRAERHLKQRRVDNGYGDYSYNLINPIKAVDTPFNLIDAIISHAHYDSDNDRDYFLINTIAGASGQVGLLDDEGNWVIAQQYDDLQPLNPCTGQQLYLQAVSTKVLASERQQQTALLDQQANIIIPFTFNQNIELFNNNSSPLFLRSTLIKGSTVTGLTQDIKDNIISAQIVNAKGKTVLASDTAIVKLLYHQLYTYKKEGKFGIINDQGEIILAPQFDSYRDEGDKVWVEKKGAMLPIEKFIKLE